MAGDGRSTLFVRYITSTNTTIHRKVTHRNKMHGNEIHEDKRGTAALVRLVQQSSPPPETYAQVLATRLLHDRFDKVRPPDPFVCL